MEEQKRDKGGWSLIRVIKGITVEPVMFITMFSFMMSFTISTNLIIDKVCRYEYHYDDDICDNLNAGGEYKQYQDKVQGRVATFNIFKTILGHSFTVFFVLLLGPYTDSYGRKYPMMNSVFWMIMQQVGFYVNVVYMEWKIERILYTATLPFALGGGYQVVFMLCYSYIADITKVKHRTKRISFVESATVLGTPIGSVVGALVFGAFGYKTLFIWTGFCLLLAFLYCAIRVRNDTHLFHKRQLQVAADAAIPSVDRTLDADVRATAGPVASESKPALKDVISFRHIKSAFVSTFRSREGSKRKIICFSMAAIVFSNMAIQGEINIHYLFSMSRMGWNEKDYSYWIIVYAATTTFGTMFAVQFMTTTMKWSDAMIGGIGCTLQIFTRILWAFTYGPLTYYLGAVVGFLSSATTVVGRSILSKTVERDEVGKAYAVLAAIESSAIPIIANFCYNYIYASTVETFEGWVYLSSTGWILLSVVCYGVAEYYSIKELSRVGMPKPRSTAAIPLTEDLLVMNPENV